MKKILSVIFIFVMTVVLSVRAEEMGFSEAMAKPEPMLVLVYAEWADNYQSYLGALDSVAAVYPKEYNYVKMNIADAGTKDFNNSYHIYPKLPYILMFRDGGKISRYIQRECVLDNSCLMSRVKSFLQ